MVIVGHRKESRLTIGKMFVLWLYLATERRAIGQVDYWQHVGSLGSFWASGLIMSAPREPSLQYNVLLHT